MAVTEDPEFVREGGDLFHAGRVNALAECLTSAIRRSTSEPKP